MSQDYSQSPPHPDKDTEHIRPLWVSQSRGPPVSQTNCEVDTGAGCNILPVHKANSIWSRMTKPPR